MLCTASVSWAGFTLFCISVWEQDLTQQPPSSSCPSLHCFSNKESEATKKQQNDPSCRFLPLGKQHQQQTHRESHWDFGQGSRGWEMRGWDSAAGGDVEEFQLRVPSAPEAMQGAGSAPTPGKQQRDTRQAQQKGRGGIRTGSSAKDTVNCCTEVIILR